ncbi:DNA transporter [Vibrio owensii 47666-1]|uniref:DNA-processing protein DprA n=1 Tax=Vibrio owensii TaxID=696485 RepID=UPI000584701F|nr:DNA-processing protein DprA [Vibrio owensii]KIF48849.1 DNA transporter [Vibrio owensii 47666-1]
MNLSNNTKAILLLTSYFSKASKETEKPLTNSEWGKFALWLKENNLVPESLLHGDAKQLLTTWSDPKITSDRIVTLLNRGHSLALAAEKWARAGIWVLTRSDVEYPWRLKSRLKTSSPPVLFGCGNKELLNSGGIAVIGSRNAPIKDIKYTERFGAKAACNHINIVSGASRGVDEAAMLGAIQAGGSVLGVLSEDLLRAVTSLKWRQSIMNGNAVLVSPFYPEAGFNAGNAMGRNKYIYCLADTALVVHSGNKGGTLSGANENLRNRWVPLWVKPTMDKDSANALLVDKGGSWSAQDIAAIDIRQMLCINTDRTQGGNGEQPDLFSAPPQPEGDETKQAKNKKALTSNDTANVNIDERSIAEFDFFNIFKVKLEKLAATPITLEELVTETKLHKSQLNDWLKRAVEEGCLNKLTRPVRYQYKSD